MSHRLKILEFLADGRFHSGESLGAHLGVTRAAVWKQLRGLQSLGVEVHAVRGRGYRLPFPVELLSADSVDGLLTPTVRSAVSEIEVFADIESTNSYLKDLARKGARSGRICLAESQHAGRGRFGRPWVSPLASNLYLSLLWRFDAGPSSLDGLSLVSGVALIQALREWINEGLGLKWPNDVQWHGRKLAGILIEVAGESTGPSHVVIGIGVNVRMADRCGAQITQPWTDMTRCLGETPSRNALAARVITQLVESLQDFQSAGLRPFLDTWRSFDATRDKPVQLHLPNAVVDGNARGIDDSGAFLLEIGDEVRRFAAGEVSLRIPS